VGEPRKKYLGERYLPLILQNIHRYFFYLAALFILLLAHDAWKGLWFTDATGQSHFGLGVGTIILILNRFFSAFTRLAVTRSGISSAGFSTPNPRRRPARKPTTASVA